MEKKIDKQEHRACPHCKDKLGYVDSSQIYPCEVCGKPICIGCAKRCKSVVRIERMEQR